MNKFKAFTQENASKIEVFAQESALSLKPLSRWTLPTLVTAGTLYSFSLGGSGWSLVIGPCIFLGLLINSWVDTSKQRDNYLCADNSDSENLAIFLRGFPQESKELPASEFEKQMAVFFVSNGVPLVAIDGLPSSGVSSGGVRVRVNEGYLEPFLKKSVEAADAIVLDLSDIETSENIELELVMQASSGAQEANPFIMIKLPKAHDCRNEVVARVQQCGLESDSEYDEDNTSIILLVDAKVRHFEQLRLDDPLLLERFKKTDSEK